MSIFFTDIIDIVRISVDEWGAETKTITSNVPARVCLLYTSPSPRDRTRSRMPSSA